MRGFLRYFPFALIVLGLVVILWTFRDYGVTIDEWHHVMHGKSVVDWYTSGFQQMLACL